MIDLHCHILPGMDDGAKDLNEAGLMLAMQRASGTEGMYLTPHFHPGEKDPGTFLAERERAWQELTSVLTQEDRDRIRLGAEVRYCEQLLTLELREMTLGKSDYFLLELPVEGYPAYLERFIEELPGKGLIPILAHVERYAYFRNEPRLLKKLVDLGALAQVSAGALFAKRDRNFAFSCMRHGLAQLAASDAHNTKDRKPCMDLIRKLPEELRQLHDTMTCAIWDNELPPYIRTSAVKKTIFGYY